MSNPYFGELKVSIGGRDATLTYDWLAISEAQGRYGNEALDGVSAALDPKIIAGLLEIGFKKHNPELSAEEIIRLSPPLVHAVKWISDALMLAFLGPEGLPKSKADSAEKKTVTE